MGFIDNSVIMQVSFSGNTHCGPSPEPAQQVVSVKLYLYGENKKLNTKISPKSKPMPETKYEPEEHCRGKPNTKWDHIKLFIYLTPRKHITKFSSASFKKI